MPAEISVLGRPEIQTKLSVFDFPGFRKKESPSDLLSIDNERTNTDIPILEPLSDAKDSKGHPIQTDELKQFFSYLSRTRQLEVDTPKTEYLQKIASRMTEGMNIKSRVVIMRKGEGKEGFCTEEGTIFLSQSLLNRLDSVDEIAAVIAHETSHLLSHTGQMKRQTWNKLGAAWTHELAADTQTPSLLEKTGFNSLASASAIEKISGASRGVVHQGGLARASESVGTHFGIDRKTSAQAFLAKPDLLSGEVKPSNLELFADAHKAQDRKKAAEMIELFHLQDLINVYQRLSKLQNQEFVEVKINESSVRVIKEDEMEIALQKKAASEIKKILAEQGVTEDEQTVVLMCITPTRPIYDSTRPDKRRFSGINNPDKIRDLARLIAKDEDQKRLDDLCQKAGFFPDTVNISSFLSTLGDNLFDPSNTPKARGIPVSEESFLDALTAIASNSDTGPLILGDGIAIENYIVRSIVKYDPKNTTPSSADKTKIQTVLKKVVERKILTDFDSIDGLINSRCNGKKFYDHTGAIASVGYFPSGMSEELVEEIMQNLLFKEEEIQSFFSNLKNLHPTSIPYELNHFLNRIERSFAGKEEGKNQISADERLRIARRIMEEMKKDERLNADRGLLRYGILATAAIFRQDTDQFYTFMDEVASSDQMRGLSPESAFSFLKPIFKKNYSSSSKNRLISNFDRFAGLPLVQLALEYSPFKPESIKSLAELFNAMEIMDRMNKNELDDQYSLESLFKQPLVFEDSLVGLILGREYRKKLLELTQKNILTGDLYALHGCLKLMYPNGPEKTHFLRAISKKILTSSDLSFENKLSYLQQNIDELGPEGLSLLAEQIEDLETYQKFRIAMQKSFGEYLSGKAATFNVAALDIISSFFAKDFKELFDLCRNDPVTQGKSSTAFAKSWLATAMHGGGFNYSVNYNPDIDKFLITEGGRQKFRTAPEIIDILHGLTAFERFAITHKALTEQNGAFSSAKNRQTLSHQIIDSLQMENPFIKSALQSACQNGDAKFLAFPASRMLGPLLFRSLDQTKIDIKEVSNLFLDTNTNRKIKDLPQENSLLKALSSGRREVSGFGSNYSNYPQTPFFRLSQESDLQFQTLTQRLHELLDEPKENGEKNGASEIDPSLDAIIKGVEGSGALGVRSLQLAVQMHEFSEPVKRRLSESFDSNPGLNKLLFWENLHKLSEEDPEVREFVQKLRLKDYLGGGSLYTTFEAVVDEDGKKRRVALKMLNPNTEAFLKENYSIAQTVLEDVRKQKGDMKKLADMGFVLTDLAHQWCLKDINDQTFAGDDDRFREIVERFNARGEETRYAIPQRVFNTYNLKAEDFAPGRTVNQTLNDREIQDETKQALVRRMAEFFAFQLKGPRVQEEEKNYALVHSDPHVGNYIVDLGSQNKPIAVIDRHMYLKLEGQDISVLEQFIAGDDLKFLSALIERVLNINNVSNRIERIVATTRVKSSLMSNYFSQKVKGKVDKFSLLRTALSEFQKRGLDVPLNLRLMMRNIQALKNLSNKYGLSFEEIYGNFKP